MGSRGLCRCGLPATRRDGLCEDCDNARYYAAHRTEIIERAKANDKRSAERLRQYERDTLKLLKPQRGRATTSRFIALQALSAAMRAEERVAQLMTYLGMDAPVLQRDPSSMLIVLDELVQPVAGFCITSPDYIRYWGAVFFGMDELYLESVGLLLQSEEPWKLFIDFANRLTRLLHGKGAEMLKRSEQLSLAEKYYSKARVHLYRISYMLCRRTKGVRVATTVFGDRPSVVNEIHANILH